MRLDLKVSDLGPVSLKNIAEPMRAYSLEVGQSVLAKPAPSATLADQPKSPASNRRLGFTPLAAAVAALLLLVAAGGWYMLGGRLMKPAQAGHLSVVVLPFANLSGDLHRNISPTASSKTSPPNFRASATASSSPATLPSSTRAEISTPRKSGRNSASAMCSKAQCSATRTGSASTPS